MKKLFSWRKRKEQKSSEVKAIADKGEVKVKNELNIIKNYNIKELIKPQGIDPNPMDYMVINNTLNVYTRTLYVKAMPQSSRFAYTFEAIFKYPNTNVVVYIDPMKKGKTIKELDDDITTLEQERDEALSYDKNRARRLNKKLSEAERLASSIESSNNLMFNIAIFITIFANSLDELDMATADLRDKASATGITLTACYKYHDEAFKVCTPIGKNTIGYWHPIDRYGLATLYHYTTSHFSHKKGALLGRNRFTGRHVFYYLFDESLRGYNAIVTGVTGSGKSTLVKKIAADLLEMGVKIIGLDSDSPINKGEYAALAEKYNGVNIEIHSDSPARLNLFDLNVEMIYDEATGKEYPVLDLKSKILDATFSVMTLARGQEENNGINNITTEIVKEIIAECYEDLEIFHNQPDSLYTSGELIKNNKLTSGKVKKEVFTLSTWYKKLGEKASKNTNETYRYHYDYLVKVMKDWLSTGTRPYFDGQSTADGVNPLVFDPSIPYINVDIHKLNSVYERPQAQVIFLIKMWEDYFKKNSENKEIAELLAAILDEVHLILRYPEGRALLVDMYKRIRKKNGGVITSTQEIIEFKKYIDTISIVTNAETKIIGAQDELLADDVQNILQLTDSEIQSVLSFKTGEYLLKSNKRKVFIKSDLLDIEREIMETNRRIINEQRKKNRAV